MTRSERNSPALLTAMLWLLVTSCGNPADSAPHLKLGRYTQHLLTRTVYTIALTEHSVVLWGTMSKNSETLEIGAEGTWAQHGEWLVIKVDSPLPYYLARIRPRGLDLWQTPFRELPEPLRFPELPEWVEATGHAEEKEIKRGAFISALTLQE